MTTQREMGKRIVDARSMLFILLALPVLAAGCAGVAPPAAVPPTTAPTLVPAPSEELPAVSDEQLAVAAGVGDIAAGEELFNQPIDGVPHSFSCSSCHSLGSQNGSDGPTLAGISVVAADRVAGMSDIDYLRQSIVDPPAYKVTGEWRSPMPLQYPDLLSEAQIDNLIAFLLTR